MLSNNASSKIVKFMAPWLRVLVYGWGSNEYIEQMHKFFENLLCNWMLNKQTINA